MAESTQKNKFSTLPYQQQVRIDLSGSAHRTFLGSFLCLTLFFFGSIPPSTSSARLSYPSRPAWIHG
jgi:hypothetical protein